ncbi:MAG: TonB-dependent receptor plug domain-containing protein [Myxococcota bacterium]
MNLLASCVFLCVSAIAAEEESTEASGGLEQLPDNTELSEVSIESLLGLETVTATRQSQRVDDVPATVYVVTEETIRARGYRNIEDVLLDIPGVQIQRNSDPETRNIVAIRGVTGNDKLVVLMDGVRVTPATNTPIPLHDNYPVVNVKRVEVVLGPASALYGPDAFSGVVNIITKTGAELSADKLVGGRAQLSYGRFDTKNGAFAAGLRTKDFQLALDGSYHASDEANLASLYPEQFSWYRDVYSQTGAMRSSVDSPDTLVQVPRRDFAMPSRAYALHARFSYGDFELGYYRGKEGHSSALGGSSDYHVYQEDSRYSIQMEAAYLRHTLKAGCGCWTLTSTLSLGWYQVDPDSLFVSTATNYQDGFRYGWGRSAKLQEEFTWQPLERLSFVAGASYENLAALAETAFLPSKYQTDRAGQLQNLYYFGTDIVDRDRQSLLILQDFYNVEFQNYGVYAQVQARPFDWVALTGGVRVDGSTRYSGSINPRLGIVLTPLPTLKLKLLYGESFLQPSVYQSYRSQGAFAPQRNAGGEIVGVVGTEWRLPNAELDPQKLRSAEAGASLQVGDNVAVSLNGFYLRIDDLIVDELRANQTFKGVQILQAVVPTNRGDSKVWGGTGRVDAVFEVGPLKSTLWSAYTYTDGKIGDAPLTYSGKHLIQGGVDLAIWKVRFSPRAMFVSETAHLRYETERFEANRARQYVLVNAFARIDDVIELAGVKGGAFVRVDNLLDRRYSNVSQQSSGDALVRTPQNPRLIFAGIEVAY